MNVRGRGVARLVPPLSERPSISGTALLDMRLRDVLTVFAGVFADINIERSAEQDSGRASEPGAPRYLSRTGLAQYLDVSLPTVARLTREGAPHIYIGDSPRYIASEVAEWLRARSSK